MKVGPARGTVVWAGDKFAVDVATGGKDTKSVAVADALVAQAKPLEGKEVLIGLGGPGGKDAVVQTLEPLPPSSALFAGAPSTWATSVDVPGGKATVRGAITNESPGYCAPFSYGHFDLQLPAGTQAKITRIVLAHENGRVASDSVLPLQEGGSSSITSRALQLAVKRLYGRDEVRLAVEFAIDGKAYRVSSPPIVVSEE
jgi:hypothetical protein